MSKHLFSFFQQAPTEAPPVQLTPTNESNWKGQENQEGWTMVPPESSDDSKDARNSMARAYLHCIRAQQAAERDAMYTDGGIVDSRSPQVRSHYVIGGVCLNTGTC